MWDLLFCNEWFLLLKALHQTAGLAAFCAADFDPEDRILCQQHFAGDIPLSIITQQDL